MWETDRRCRIYIQVGWAVLLVFCVCVCIASGCACMHPHELLPPGLLAAPLLACWLHGMPTLSLGTNCTVSALAGTAPRLLRRRPESLLLAVRACFETCPCFMTSSTSGM